MKKIILLAFVLVLFSTAVVVRLISPVVSYPAETELLMEVDLPVHNIDSGKNFSTIQEAIDDNETLDGHTILVGTGTYYEHVVVGKSVWLIGKDLSITIIDGSSVGNVVEVTADNVTVMGFTIRNSGKEPPDMPYAPGDSGIAISNVKNCNVSGNKITKNFSGVGLLNSSSNNVTGNYIIDNTSAGVVLANSSSNSISGNDIIDNSDGTRLSWSSDNVLSGNKMKENGDGIRLYWSDNNTITGNEIMDNACGMKFDESSNNVLRDNVMAGNTYNFGVEGVKLSDFMNDVDASNTVNGRPVFCLVNEQKLVIDPQAYPNIGYLAVINSTNVAVRNLNMENNGQGVLFAYTKNSSIQNVTVTSNFQGIQLRGSSNNSIYRNNIIENHYGIMLSKSPNNSITGNNIKNNRDGVWLWYSSNKNTVSGNNITTNNAWGIDVWSSDNNTISANNITDNGWAGVGLMRSDNNIISGNNITDNDERGIQFDNSSNNIIYHNNFINNKHQVYDLSWEYPWLPPSINTWDDGYSSGGNYWSNYNGTDTNQDGIGDTPYVIDENNRDNYPLMSPWSPKPPVEEEIPFWIQWWFWAIVTAGTAVLAGAVYFLKKRKPPTPTAPPLPTEGTLQNTHRAYSCHSHLQTKTTQNTNPLKIIFSLFKLPNRFYMPPRSF